MADSTEKVPIALAGPEDVEQCMPPAYSAVTGKPTTSSRLLKFGAVVLLVGAVLLLLGTIGAFYFWKVSDKHVYNVHYSMSINGRVQEGSMEIDTENNQETFKTGSGNDEAVEVHDFQIGITGIRFAGGEKCYIKAQSKAHLPDMDSLSKETMSFDLEDEIMPAKFDEESLIWIAAEEPIKDNSFLSPKILDLCGELPIFWLRPTYPKDGQRKKREVKRMKRQRTPATASRNQDADRAVPEARSPRPEEEEEETPTFNPENPYHQIEGEEGEMIIDPRLDHEGICCAECRRGYTHCQRICEPLRGYYPYPYNYDGCRVSCRVIMPCRWWVARILGLV
ncbi:leukocyte cell-derived chemotaxin 1 [Protopterus annectens]|uniref:leukocyte cell-derived chemotaxin 1 n=1 Tax=Protopterus annectens TaxID=7888 RepID=UPI001CFA6944|nr:leukocyte cell-derived chemotaxin 1 [Protopterus annectens]